jgi:heme A synthase
VSNLVPSDARPWPRRAALLCALFALPLLLFGGSVTTLGAGMAVDGWLIAEGHFLLFFPVEEWFRDTATFVEHTHRLFGVLVGLCACACLVLALFQERRRSARLGALAALLAVSLQGTLGGLRVLENEPRLAFLHGALAQLVFVVLCANAVLFSRAWRTREGASVPAVRARRDLLRAAYVAFAVTCGQVAFGAWYRHGLRPAPVPDSNLRFLLHGLGAVLVIVTCLALLRSAAALRAAEGHLPAGLERATRSLPILLIVQLVLGGLAWAGFRPDAIGPAEWALSIAHVLGGALLFATVGVIALWAQRLASEAACAGTARAVLGGAS